MTSYWQHERHRAYHLRQYDEPYRSTVALAEFVNRVAPDLRGTALDVGCGAGASISYLKDALPPLEWLGLDLEYLDEARARQPDVEFIDADFFELDRLGKKFDVVFSIQTLSWLATYEAPLEQLLSVTARGGRIFVTSLFTDSTVDATTTVRLPDGSESYYNVYALDRFSAVCDRLGAHVVAAEDFTIDVDLDPPSDGAMGTYTRRLDDGTRLQFSGPLWMPWKFLLLAKG